MNYFIIWHSIFLPQWEWVVKSQDQDMKQCFQGCSFLAACPSEQSRLGCDRRGPDSVEMKTGTHPRYTEEKSSWRLLEWKVENTRCQSIWWNDGWQRDNYRDQTQKLWKTQVHWVSPSRKDSKWTSPEWMHESKWLPDREGWRSCIFQVLKISQAVVKGCANCHSPDLLNSLRMWAHLRTKSKNIAIKTEPEVTQLASGWVRMWAQVTQGWNI